MSTSIIFTVPGRTANYMPIDVNAPKEIILEKYARESYSTENTWPYDSPSAGYYDITNSDTKLILLNKKITWSHLRGKTKPKREPFVKDEFYDWVEKEIEMKAQSEKNSNSSRDQSASKRAVDPSRHFSAIGCTFKPNFKEDSTNTFKSKSFSKSAYSWTRPRISTGDLNKKKELNKEEREELIKYFYEMSTRKVGLHDKTHVKNPPPEFLSSYNINHPELKNGQKLYLSNLCQVYSVSPLKKSKKSQYLSLLDRQKEIDKWSRDKFRMHDGENFPMYRDYIKSQRPVPNFVNCGYLHPKQTRDAFVPQKSKKRVFYSANDSSNKQASDSISSKSTESYSSQSTDFNTNGEKDQKGKILSDLSNTDYESSSLSSESTISSNSEKESETSRSLSQISHLSDGFNTNSSSSSTSDDPKSATNLILKAESSSEKAHIEVGQTETELDKLSHSSSPFESQNTNRSEFMNSSRLSSSKIAKTPSKASSNAPKKPKPIQIVRKSEDEEE